MKKKILVVDDSALMRRIVCDIINSDDRFEVGDTAVNGVEALDLLTKNKYDAVVLDIVMPQMDGLKVLKELNARHIYAKVIMNSTLTKEGADITMEALDEGAMEFVHKPSAILDAKGDAYRESFLTVLDTVCKAMLIPKRTPAKPVGKLQAAKDSQATTPQVTTGAFTKTVLANKSSSGDAVKYNPSNVKGKKLIAIASSTGGPKALQEVIPKFPATLNVPVLIVQHMPAGFTASLAERLDSLSKVHVKEAAEGDILKPGWVYLAKGGVHMQVVRAKGQYQIVFTNEPPREGVKPCANYMYESLKDSDYDEICCVVMTGMGADGTQGIANLKKSKKVHVIAQQADTCAVYGMPRSIVNNGLADEIVPLEELAQTATKNVGVH